MPALKNVREERFCRLVADGMSQGRAAFKAGYAADSGQSGSAQSRGSKLMKRDAIKARVEEIREERLRRYDVTADRIVLETARIAFFDPSELNDEDGRLLDLQDMPEGARRAIASLEIEDLFRGRGEDRAQSQRVTKLKTWSKSDALALLARIKGMLKDQVDVTTNGESLNLSFDQRLERVTALLDAARARRDGQAAD